MCVFCKIMNKQACLRLILSLQFFLVAVALLNAQDTLFRNKAVFDTVTPGFYQKEILRSIHAKSISPRKTYLAVEGVTADYPVNPHLYTRFWHTPPQSQGASGTCWAFGSVALIESEQYRAGGQEVKLSEMYIVYWEYVERAAAFADSRGKTTLGEGSEAAATLKIIQEYGIVPWEAYNGKLPGQKVYNHEALVSEILGFLEHVECNGLWDKNYVTSTVRDILDHYMGRPPQTFIYRNREFTPVSFRDSVIKVQPADLVSFMSSNSESFGNMTELREDDNWRPLRCYYNVSIADFTALIVSGLKNGYTACICGDVSEAGMLREKKVSIVPTFDIPAEYIDDDSRQLRLSDGSTTDDHCMQIVGYGMFNNQYWFLVKDSGAGAWSLPDAGYRYMNLDYIRLKMMNVLIHKAAATFILDNIIK